MKGKITFRTFNLDVFVLVTTNLAYRGIDVVSYLDESNDEYVVTTVCNQVDS